MSCDIFCKCDATIDQLIDVIEGNMINLPFDNNTFDGLLVVASYHHLTNNDDRKKAINEMYRVVKDDGLVFIEVWNEINNKWKGKNKTYIRYYYHYTQEELANEIITFCPNFKIIEQGYEKSNWFIILKKIKD
jgi:ubiquinone/menaquinone biosynthesis C-methylase UbiE